MILHTVPWASLARIGCFSQLERSKPRLPVTSTDPEQAEAPIGLMPFVGLCPSCVRLAAHLALREACAMDTAIPLEVRIRQVAQQLSLVCYDDPHVIAQ